MTINKKVLGELIGLARTTDGNEHLINATATTVILDCLKDITHAQDEDLLCRIDNAKRQMVPDCYLCATPCGKNSAYDVDAIQNEIPAVRTLKLSILDALARFAKSGQTVSREEEPLLYQSLILLGMDAPSEEILRSYHTRIFELL